jgi:hypothetical protein
LGAENLDSKATRSNLASCFLDYKTPNDIGVLRQGWEKRNSHLETGKQEQVNQAAFLILDADESLHIWQP